MIKLDSLINAIHDSLTKADNTLLEKNNEIINNYFDKDNKAGKIKASRGNKKLPLLKW